MNTDHYFAKCIGKMLTDSNQNLKLKQDMVKSYSRKISRKSEKNSSCGKSSELGDRSQAVCERYEVGSKEYAKVRQKHILKRM